MMILLLPVISQIQYDKIIDLIRSGINEGATLVAGGPEKDPHRLDGDGDGIACASLR